jgi:RAT1-interacting protein
MLNLERKLMKFWLQSFLLGVPKIIIGYRDHQGILRRIEEMETANIPGNVKRNGKKSWDGNVCINFGATFLDCELSSVYPDYIEEGDGGG